jgi:beta-N-acetylhexosaminidase
LRDQCGFTGWVISDDLSMQAAHVAGDMSGRIESALTCGCHIVLICNYKEDVVDVLDRVPEIKQKPADLSVCRKKIQAATTYQWTELARNTRAQEIRALIEDSMNATT